MLVELGNENPVEVIQGNVGMLVGPTVTRIQVRDDATYEVAKKGAVMDIGGEEKTITTAKDLAAEVALHLMSAPGLSSHLPQQEALVEVLRTWELHSQSRPSWVRCTDKNFEKLLSEMFQCPIAPGEVE